MLSINAQKLSKKFFGKWIFKDISFSLEGAGVLAVVGENGSGKSTLLRIVAGQLMPTSGKLDLKWNGKKIKSEKVYTLLSYMAPAIECYPQLTLWETYQLHFRFKPLRQGYSIKRIFSILSLDSFSHLPLFQLSSGTLQRAKLGLALFADTPLLLLDEPTTFMDAPNANYAINLIQDLSSQRLLIVASNLQREYSFIHNRIILK
ncbi:MAG: ATP-binding cassette domain-containing protein [Bacteroidia bacterium]|nr:ATP-binding cassette domain-containing protein [Bacteroidia bacterium]MDW8157305.1 ATP-binding cassette domain-containing protein [Bacteroidia bacterium]